MKTSDLEYAVECQIKMLGWPMPEREHRFNRPRSQHRFDFCWPDYRIALEVEGGIWLKKGRHTSGAGFTGDCRKYSIAAIAGWMVIRVTGDMVKNGEAMQFLEQALKARGCQLPDSK